MTIEISRFTGRPLQDAADTAASPGQRPAANAPGVSAGALADKVSFTRSAALLQDLEKETASLPAVDSGRVEAIHHAVATGTYQVDPARAAEKLLQIERALATKDGA
jgi:negative regulator of flagellin synthesis FlgM